MVNKICVVGSFNIDVTVSMKRFPKVGETIICDTFDVLVGGGKGANQAVALGKLGADVTMAGKLGDRFYGPEYMDVLRQNHVGCSMVEMEQGMIPGSAIVAVDGNSDNRLIIHPGANSKVSVEYIKRHWARIAACDIVLLQLEIPDETNLYLARELKAAGKTVIFDPAPAKKAAAAIFPYADYVTPNETELEAYTGVAAKSDRDFQKAGELLLQKGAKTVIAKAGKGGAYLITRERFTHIPSWAVNAVDPTAAGDCFNAGLAYGLANNWELIKTIRFANAVAGISTSALGAQSAMPSYETVMEFMKNRS